MTKVGFCGGCNGLSEFTHPINKTINYLPQIREGSSKEGNGKISSTHTSPSGLVSCGIGGAVFGCLGGGVQNFDGFLSVAAGGSRCSF